MKSYFIHCRVPCIIIAYYTVKTNSENRIHFKRGTNSVYIVVKLNVKSIMLYIGRHSDVQGQLGVPVVDQRRADRYSGDERRTRPFAPGAVRRVQPDPRVGPAQRRHHRLQRRRSQGNNSLSLNT